jgi:type IV pilus assembly protein PilE
MRRHIFSHRDKSPGFTLIEVMITVAIIAILSAIALPGYRDYVTRGRIPEATTRLATLQAQLESYFQDNRTYVGFASCAATDTTSSKYFDFSCANLGTGTFTLQAVGKNAMASFTFTVNQNNVKATPSVPTGWATSTTCWVRSKDGSC